MNLSNLASGVQKDRRVSFDLGAMPALNLSFSDWTCQTLSWMLWGMENQWARVGQQARARRKELRLTQEDVKARGGPSTALQRQVESGTYAAEMHPGVRRGYENALRWDAYSIDFILGGRDAVALEQGPELAIPDQRFPSVGPGDNDEPEFEFLTRVREDLTTEQMEQLMTEATPYLEMLVRDIKNRNREA